MDETVISDSYIQINIYARKLDNLRQDGVDLEKYLKDIGCDKFWIGEVPLVNNPPESPIRSLVGDDETIDIARIPNKSSQLVDASDCLSSTLTEVKAPRCSTPIVSRFGFSFENLLSGVSNINPVDVDDFLGENVTLNAVDGTGRCPETRKLLSMESTVELSNKDQQSSPVLRSQIKSVPVERSEVNTNKRTSAPSISNVVSRLLEQALKMPRSAKAEHTDFDPSMFSSSSDKNTERIYCELKPAYPLNYDYSQGSTSTFEGDGRENSFFSANNTYPSIEQVAQFRNANTTLELNNSIHSECENGEAFLDFEEVEGSERGGNAPQTNSVETVYVFKCKFKGCEKSFRWRKKYGKARLIDHALTHMPGRLFNCSECEFTGKTVRSIRYHFKNVHKEFQVTELRMKRLGLVQSAGQNPNFIKVWKKCFHDELISAGFRDFDPFLRQDRNSKRTKRGNIEES